jgi:putative redox protein
VSDVEADLRWEGGTLLSARSGRASATLDWGAGTAPSPVQALVLALAGCMASDVVLILEKGRERIEGLTARVTAERAEKPPRRLLRVDIRFAVTGAIAPEKIDRAIRLSRETYCSVWHSMARDIELTTSFEVSGGPPG